MKKIHVLLLLIAAYVVTIPCRAYRDLETGTFITRDPTGFVDGPNLYAYVVQNPWTKFDPEGLYESDFHYGAVYYIMRSKGYSAQESNRIAGFSQYVDDNSKTEPLYTTDKNRTNHHFIGSDEKHGTVRNNSESRGRVQDAFSRYGQGEGGSVYRVGDALHGFADTFAHEGFTGGRSDINKRTDSWRPNIGHADAGEGGHAPDRPYNDIDKTIAAAKAIYDLTPGSSAKGAIQQAWNDVEKELRSAFAYKPNESDPEKNEQMRCENMQSVIKKKFGDDAKYDKKEFEKEKTQFEGTIKQQDAEREKRK